MTQHHILALSVNHHHAPIAIREKLAFPAQILFDALTALKQQNDVLECAILSTCNRTELYCVTHDKKDQSVIQWMLNYHHIELSTDEIKNYFSIRSHEEAVRHVFRVASGLESMVLGETQILGQMKQAIKFADEHEGLGTVLHKLFQQTYSVAKQVRTDTMIGQQSISMAAAAIRLSERVFENVSDQRILFIGAGEMIELCVTHFHAIQPQKMTIINRTFERAKQLAERFNAHTIEWENLNQHLAEFDIIITSTGSPNLIIDKPMIKQALKQRRHKPMVLVDLAVPRDVDSAVSDLDDAFLYTVDDLSHVVQLGLESRKEAIYHAENIINQQVELFIQWIENRQTVPLIRKIRHYAEDLRQQELAKAQKRLAKGESPEKVLEYLSHALSNKLLHVQMQGLNHENIQHREEISHALHHLYHKI